MRAVYDGKVYHTKRSFGNPFGWISMDKSRGEMTVAVDTIPVHSGNVFTVLDSEMTIVHESSSVEDRLGYGQGERVGERLTEWIHPDDQGLVTDALGALTVESDDTGEPITYRQRRADGSYMVMKSVASVTAACNARYLLNTVDVSSAKPVQADEAVDQFARVVSHDLRSPLQVASSRVDLLSEDCESEHIEHIQQAHQRMEELIQDLLALAQSQTPVDDVEWVEFADVCRTCWQNVSTEDATLSVDLDRPIQADRSRLQQLLENLTRNAVDHGGDDVTVRIGEVGDTDGFYVADDGVGIDEEIRESIFENGFSTVPDGTGFGLAIASEVAEAHGWQIDVDESREGGARFEISGVDVRDECE